MSFITDSPFSPFFTPEKLRNHLAQGLPALLLDDTSRENEADLVTAASTITLATMAMMIREGSGIVCLCLTEQQTHHLKLPAMVENNQSRYQTAFTVSIEARHGVTTGVSAADRLTTIKTAIAVNAQPEDLVRPGHVFPLRANPGGLHVRRGHTEGTVALSRWAKLGDASVLCELTNPDGTMAKGDQVTHFALQHQLPILTLDDVIMLMETEASLVPG